MGLVSPYQLGKMVDAQRVVLRDGNFDTGNADKKAIISTLTGMGATILGLIFVTNTAVGIAAGVASIAATLYADDDEGILIKRVLDNGIRGMQDIVTDMVVFGSRYDMYQIRFPFLEYTMDDGSIIRFVSGNGIIERVHSNNGWEILN